MSWPKTHVHFVCNRAAPTAVMKDVRQLVARMVMTSLGQLSWGLWSNSARTAIWAMRLKTAVKQRTTSRIHQLRNDVSVTAGKSRW